MTNKPLPVRHSPYVSGLLRPLKVFNKLLSHSLVYLRWIWFFMNTTLGGAAKYLGMHLRDTMYLGNLSVPRLTVHLQWQLAASLWLVRPTQFFKVFWTLTIIFFFLSSFSDSSYFLEAMCSIFFFFFKSFVLFYSNFTHKTLQFIYMGLLVFFSYVVIRLPFKLYTELFV